MDQSYVKKISTHMIAIGLNILKERASDYKKQ